VALALNKIETKHNVEGHRELAMTSEYGGEGGERRVRREKRGWAKKVP